MTQLTIINEQPFQVLAHSFGVSNSPAGYTLAYSADGINYTNYTDATPANETLIVNGVPKGFYFKLVGNTGSVVINY